MHQRNLNYHLDLLPEAQQAAQLPELAKLLENVWFKHLIAQMLVERDLAREAVCSWPLKDLATTFTALQTRGEAVAYENASDLAYVAYNHLIQQKKEQDEHRDTRTDD